MAEFTIVPCEECDVEVIHVRTERGRDLAVVAEPVLGGKFALREAVHGERPEVRVPLPKFAFGRRLYVEHKGCPASSRTRRKAAADV